MSSGLRDAQGLKIELIGNPDVSGNEVGRVVRITAVTLDANSNPTDWNPAQFQLLLLHRGLKFGMGLQGHQTLLQSAAQHVEYGIGSRAQTAPQFWDALTENGSITGDLTATIRWQGHWHGFLIPRQDALPNPPHGVPADPAVFMRTRLRFAGGLNHAHSEVVLAAATEHDGTAIPSPTFSQHYAMGLSVYTTGNSAAGRSVNYHTWVIAEP